MFRKRCGKRLRRKECWSGFAEGDRVAIAVGSRGVDIDVMTREVVRLVRSRGGQPFIAFPWAATGGNGGGAD
ncbi:hypothetical protein SAMN04488025_10199 [Planifilum fulgidum]|uniref:Uncharacterized protein n=1 Tax=Planifilum fulgidum TaxID=201973 RepID=A0A1I2KA33_9BACL|nr:hypothetical protein SAMN04488025_10199 [Planifilum fulgidum]